jgi:ABC-type Na+ efflux pump permease subunit
MKKVKNILIVLSIIMCIYCTGNKVYASAGQWKGQADSWLQNGMQNPPITTEEAWEKLLPIGQILVAIASVVLVICFMYLGIKYMTADPSGKADVKQKLIGLVVATVVIYGGMGIFAIIVNLMNSILA